MNIKIQYDEDVVEVFIEGTAFLFEPLMASEEIVDNLEGMLSHIPNLTIWIEDMEE